MYTSVQVLYWNHCTYSYVAAVKKQSPKLNFVTALLPTSQLAPFAVLLAVASQNHDFFTDIRTSSIGEIIHGLRQF